MACAGRQDGDIARLQREDPPGLAAEADPPLAPRDAEHLMDSGVIVHVVVDAVAPRGAPSACFEQVLDHGSRILTLIECDGAPIDDQGPPRMIGDETIILEADGVGFSCPREVWSFPFAGPP